MDPLTNIQDKKAWTDFGRQGYFIMNGAMIEGASVIEALQIVSAFYSGMFSGLKKNDDKEDVT